MDLVTPGFGLVFWTIISFLILLIVLRKLAWKPILGALSDREEGIQNALDAAEKAKLEMANLNADNERLLQEARAERETMMKEAREIKSKMISDAKEEAQAEANKTIANAQTAIESEKKAAISELKSTVATLSVDIAEKMVKGQLSDKSKQLELINSMLNDAKLN